MYKTVNQKSLDRLSIVGLGLEEITLIKLAGAQITPMIGTIVEAFYDHLILYPPLRDIISQNTTTDRLKGTFHRYLIKLFSGTFNEDYEFERIQIGKTHHRVGLPLKWYLSMFGFLEHQIYSSLRPRYEDLPLKNWIALQRSISGLIKYDQLLAVDAYVEAYTADLRQETEVAQQARKSKSLFLAKVSHELRTPLSSILGYTDLILDTSREISPVTRQHLQVLHRNANNLLSTINGLIEIGHADSGKWQSELTNGTISALFDDMAINAEGLLVGKPVRIDKAYTGKSAPAIYTDFSKLRQILLNLVSNACKFTDSGYVVLDFEQTERSLVIIVRDSGPGIPAEQRDKVFEDFYRIQNGSVRKPGSGLGLTLVKTLIESMDGTIAISDEKPNGTVFTLTLPLKS
jgi:signal transduction histidine kinase